MLLAVSNFLSQTVRQGSRVFGWGWLYQQSRTLYIDYSSAHIWLATSRRLGAHALPPSHTVA